MKYLLLVLVALSHGAVIGQHILQTQRVEIPYKFTEENYLIATAGEQGIILFRESEERVSKKNVWEIKVIDTNLDDKMDFKVEVEYKYEILGYEYRNSVFYLLFDDTNSSKSEFLLVKSSIQTGDTEYHPIANELAMDLSHLIINDKTVVLGGYINHRPSFMIFNYIQDKVQVVPGFFSSRSEVLDFNYDDNHKLYNVLMGQKNALNHNELALKSFDNNGKVIIDEKYEFDENLRALNGKMIISETTQVVVAGSFAENNSYYSQGLYLGQLKAGKKLRVNKTLFSELDHLFDYMSPKRAAKMRQKAIDARKAGSKFEFKTQAYVHQLYEQDGEFVVTSELYKPEFKDSPSPMSMGYSDLSSNEYRDNTGQKYVSKSSRLTNTDGASHIEYNESMISGFDQNGKLLWDQSLPLHNVETLALEQVAQVNKKGDNLIMMYKQKNNIAYKVIDLADNESNADSTMVISTFNELDEIDKSDDRQGKIQHWYGDNYIIWGYQKITNPSNTATEKKRSVFFINKLVVE